MHKQYCCDYFFFLLLVFCWNVSHLLRHIHQSLNEFFRVCCALALSSSGIKYSNYQFRMANTPRLKPLLILSRKPRNRISLFLFRFLFSSIRMWLILHSGHRRKLNFKQWKTEFHSIIFYKMLQMYSISDVIGEVSRR